ncbi:MAG: tetratricopeptide repeat protein, partial [Gammaproteobacteria bacterium]|nr:tetratricopeptide repeat protein [Gammaproteobacteria bacterium]
MKPILRTVFCLGLCWLAAIAPAQTIPGKGESAFRNGNFSGAAIHWQAALEELASSPEQPEYAEILRKLGRAYHALGRHGEAEACLLLALSSALPANLSKPNQKRWCHGLPRPLSNDSTANEEALALAALSEVYRLTEKNAQAKERARQAVEKAGSDFRIQAAVFNQSGNSHTISDEEYYDYEAAIEAYQKAAHFARQAGDERLLANILLNIAQVMADDVDRPLEKKKSSFNHAWQAVEKLKEKPESSARKILPECKSAANPVYDYARHLIHLGQIAWLMQKSYPKAALFKSKGSNALIEAQCFAAVFPRIGSYANAYLGRLYLAEGEEAHSYTRQAIFFAQQLQSADMLYRWELQLGQVLRDSGDIENAINAYQRAFFYMQKLRAKAAVTRHHGKAKSFRETEE